MTEYSIKTKTGEFLGLESDDCYIFKGIPYARAGRFEYAAVLSDYDKPIDARTPGPACMQKRAWPEFEHLEIPERQFYHKEYRDGQFFTYDEENSLNLNIFMPKSGDNLPVIVFFHGGGFDSGCINESPFDGTGLASRGCIVVFAQYRVSVFGYFTHEDIFSLNGRDGNFGLDDMVVALNWVKMNISQFNGNPDNVTVMGQSAGAMSIQYLLCSPKTDGLFGKAVMLSGAGLFPKFSLPRPCEQTRAYWTEVMELCGCRTLDEIKNISPKKLLEGVEKQKSLRKDNTFNTMPVIDHHLLPEGVDKLISGAKNMPLIIGITNNDMYTFLLAHVSKKYAKKHGAYLYYFDVDAPGDGNKAFHSSDIRYVFGTLSSSWRPYTEKDYAISRNMMDYLASFSATGNPNHEGAPKWEPYTGKVLRISRKGTGMGRTDNIKLLLNTLKGDPK
ncbi:MAG: carboxylesterase family protein [Clostridiales bacterium]|nr:carboxylesterase family protein [Clostridiales bacterium]